VTGVLVTGAAGDIGAAIAARLASTGSDVILADHPAVAAQLAESAERCRGLGGEVSATTFDVTDERATGTAIGTLGQIGGLVNGAGLQGAFAPIDSYPLADARLVFDVNVLGLFAVLAAVSRRMIESGRGGSIVNIASILGLVGDGILAAYCAAKGGVLGITRATAVQYGRDGIRCNAICPGDIDTPLVQAYFDTADDPAALRAQVSAEYPLERIAAPREIARTAVFLAGDDASFMSGQPLVVDGGLLATCY
jgi:NAD(P)-dependent dehydrogenase (short-subunit alcohol dehydrogenase family)